MKYIVSVFSLLFIFLFFLFCPVAHAREVYISSNKTSLSPDEELIVTASISGFLSDEIIYLKGAFFQDGTSNYFGYTKYNNDWIKNSSSSDSQKQVKVGEWDLQTIIKNDSFDSGFKGSGTYKLKLGFYYISSNGNLSAINWSANTMDVSLVQPSATPTPVPSSTSAPTSTKPPTPTTTLLVVATPIGLITKVTSSKIKPTVKLPASKGSVLGSTSKRVSIPEVPIASESEKKPFVLPPIFLILGVLVIIAACGILLFQEWKKQKALEL